jgi:hypothetical protein
MSCNCMGPKVKVGPHIPTNTDTLRPSPCPRLAEVYASLDKTSEQYACRVESPENRMCLDEAQYRLGKF